MPEIPSLLRRQREARNRENTSERQRQRKHGKNTERDRQTDRQKARERERKGGKDTERDKEIETDRQTARERGGVERERGREREGERGGERERETERETERRREGEGGMESEKDWYGGKKTNYFFLCHWNFNEKLVISFCTMAVPTHLFTTLALYCGDIDGFSSKEVQICSTLSSQLRAIFSAKWAF